MLRTVIKAAIISSVALILLFDFGVLILNIHKKKSEIDGITWPFMCFAFYATCSFIVRQGIFINMIFEIFGEKMDLDFITPTMLMAFLVMMSCLSTDSLVLFLMQASVGSAMMIILMLTCLFAKYSKNQINGNGPSIFYLADRSGDGIVHIV